MKGFKDQMSREIVNQFSQTDFIFQIFLHVVLTFWETSQKLIYFFIQRQTVRTIIYISFLEFYKN